MVQLKIKGLFVGYNNETDVILVENPQRFLLTDWKRDKKTIIELSF